MAKKTLLIVYSNLGLGGIPVKIVDIANEMKKSNRQTKIYILLKKKSSFDLRSKITNPNVSILNFDSAIFRNNSFLFVLWVWRFILITNPQTILSFISPYALPVVATKILFFWRKTTLIISEDHFTTTMIRGMAFPAIQEMGIKLLYPLAHTIIVPTDVIKEELTKTFHVPDNLIFVIPSWSVYANQILPSVKRNYDIIYGGRLDKTKNILAILSLIKGLLLLRSNTRLTCCIVGDGPSRSECINYITNNNLQHVVSLYPPTADETTYLNYLNRSKIFLFYPERYTEGLPMVIVDAMACGTIVVSKYFEGIDRTIHNNITGYIGYSDKELLTQINKILHSYASQSRVIALAKRWVSRYNSPTNIRRYIKLFHV